MKVGIFKFTLRRYVMACTLIVTTKLAILVHPLVCKVWHLVPLPWDEGMEVNGGLHVWPWMFTFLTIGIVVGAIWLYNKATAYVFGE